MNITYACPECQRAVRLEIASGASALACPHCEHSLRIPADAMQEGRLCRCIICSGSDLYLRKDFPQRLGVLFVVIGIIVSSVYWALRQPYWATAVLFATALIDFVLYLVLGNSLVCYRCETIYRNLEQLDRPFDHYGAFDLDTHERYRQQAARLEKQKSHSSPDVP